MASIFISLFVPLLDLNYFINQTNDISGYTLYIEANIVPRKIKTMNETPKMKFQFKSVSP